MTAYRRRGLRHRPHWQADAALALPGHGLAQLLDQRRVIIEQLQVPVDVRAAAEPGDREDLRPVCVQRVGVVWRHREPVPEPLRLGDLLREVITQECRLHTIEPGKPRQRARRDRYVMLHRSRTATGQPIHLPATAAQRSDRIPVKHPLPHLIGQFPDRRIIPHPEMVAANTPDRPIWPPHSADQPASRSLRSAPPRNGISRPPALLRYMQTHISRQRPAARGPGKASHAVRDLLGQRHHQGPGVG